MPNGILVATDFSEAASRAVALAGTLAASGSLPLIVAHAWNPGALTPQLFSGEIPVGPLMEQARATTRERLAEVVAAQVERDVLAEAVMLDGAASRVIPALATERRVDFVVVGRKGSAALQHVLLGSVSERIARAAPCPVLVVPASATVVPPKRVLVGVDYSGQAVEAIATADRLMRRLGEGVELGLVHAFHAERAEWLASWSEAGRALHDAHDAAAVRRWLSRALEDRVDASVQIVEGPADHVLVETAARENFDWLVVGLQGRTALATFMMGSTTRRVLELADRPVLVVPPRSAPEREPPD